jgi:hypothetical protein
MEDSAHQENMLSAARAGKFTKADLEAACSIAAAGALKGADMQREKQIMFYIPTQVQKLAWPRQKR